MLSFNKKIISLCLLCLAQVACATETALSNGAHQAGVGLQSSATFVSHPEHARQSHWQNKVSDILMHALSLTGIKYQYGGSSPETGFDCSGFVRYVFRQSANIALPPTARAISQMGKSVKKEELKPGDLVFFNTLKSAFSHVGIYIGNNRFIHAPSTGKTVRVEAMDSNYWQTRFNGAQRLEAHIDPAEITPSTTEATEANAETN